MQNNKFTKKREADNRQLLFVSIFMFIHVVIKQVELKIEIESRLYCIDIIIVLIKSPTTVVYNNGCTVTY